MTKISRDLKGKILALKEAGIKPIQISKQLKINRNTLKSFLAKLKLRASLPPKIKLRRGYFTERVPLNIKTYIKQNPVCTSAMIMDHCGLTCSRRSLEMWLNQNGLARKPAKRNILLRDANRMKRLAFCQELLTWPDEKLDRIMFTDETMVKAYPNGEKVFYRGDPMNKNIVSPVVQQGGAGQMRWGCISVNAYGPLVAIQGHVTGDSYLKMLKDFVKPELDASRQAGTVLIFQQDNAKPHSTAPVKAYLGNWGYEVLNWPPQSPDLSPIENIWNVMKMRMKALRDKSNHEERYDEDLG